MNRLCWRQCLAPRRPSTSSARHIVGRPREHAVVANFAFSSAELIPGPPLLLILSSLGYKKPRPNFFPGDSHRRSFPTISSELLLSVHPPPHHCSATTEPGPSSTPLHCSSPITPGCHPLAGASSPMSRPSLLPCSPPTSHFRPAPDHLDPSTRSALSS